MSIDVVWDGPLMTAATANTVAPATKPDGIERAMDRLFAQTENLAKLVDMLDKSTSWFRRQEEAVPSPSDKAVKASPTSPAAHTLADLAYRIDGSILCINKILSTIDTSLTA